MPDEDGAPRTDDRRRAADHAAGDLSPLLANNRAWAARMEREHQGFFGGLAAQQRPRYLWIGCADSRVPANEIIGLPPGEVFGHRNVANLVVHSDLNSLAVLDFAVNRLGIEEIIVCGHYGCGGVKAALAPAGESLSDHWIRHVRDIAKFYRDELEATGGAVARERRLCESSRGPRRAAAEGGGAVEEGPVVACPRFAPCGRASLMDSLQQRARG